MDREQLKALWLREQSIAHVHGWDFSHLKGRYTEEDDLPWDYRELVLSQLQPSLRLLDMETGGGEFLLSLGHLHQNTAATEGYAPNAALCRQRLLPLGIDFREAQGEGPLPFEAASFDLVINRHGAYNASEVLRVLKPRGLFITQQVGAENDRELVEFLLPGMVPLPFPQQYLETKKKELAALGFEILAGEEAFRPIVFYDVGALVWFARIIEWEFPGFSVETALDRLYLAQQVIEREGKIAGRIHRFYIAARKRE